MDGNLVVEAIDRDDKSIPRDSVGKSLQENVVDTLPCEGSTADNYLVGVFAQNLQGALEELGMNAALGMSIYRRYFPELFGGDKGEKAKGEKGNG